MTRLIRAAPQPTAIVGPAFRATEAMAAGMTRYACAPARMTAPTSSIRTIEPLKGLDEWTAAYALALPDDVVFSHITAARLWGLPLPRSIAAEPGLHVMRATDRPRIERLRCVHHKGLEHRAVATQSGLPVTSLADTWLDVASAYAYRLSLRDVVMMGDAVVERLRPTKFVDEVHPEADPSTPDWWRDPATDGCQQLREIMLARPRFRGKAVAAEALRFIRPRVWSAMESYARMVVVEAELPEPQLNKSAHADGTGALIGIVDLHWKSRSYRNKVAGQGKDDHAEDEPSRDRDNTRRLLLEDDDWKVHEIYARDVFNPARRARMVGRLARWLVAV